MAAAHQFPKTSMYLDQNPEAALKNFDDDGREKRTAVIGSGVLSLAWAIAQLGWVAGPAVLVAFSMITYLTATLLADCYRSPDPVTGKRNYTYMDVVKAHLVIRLGSTVGGKAMESLVKEGFIQGVLDITTTEVADYLIGGVMT
ncbi:amino acid permease 6 [Cucumis melo var. makuwa]|uniref:Amino acid permease 6 n=1 Tax=Cucumis melo var. makuwa TaxID=1194695 RepID=A0A5A7UB49_CUCMM|nr:amino acid permease 6 [Cucumis melo var. makuwa]TYK05631.1 amino acid permease 6 [Cucumis melo var. makuwa]TYK19226.1 amino acid permease 6 [Cucumis melo var. makuwa]